MRLTTVYTTDYRLLILPTNCLRIEDFHVIKNADQRPALSLKYLQRTFVCKYNFRVAVNVEVCHKTHLLRVLFI